jgi:hypothetical protein
MRNLALTSVLSLTLALAACGGSYEVAVTGPLPDTDVGVPLPDFDAEPVPPDVLIAEATVAPLNGAIITGIVRLEVVGWNMRNVQLLPPTGYSPVYANFIVSEDGRAALVDFDTRTVPNGALDVRISAFNRFISDPNGREFVALRPHTWYVLN